VAAGGTCSKQRENSKEINQHWILMPSYILHLKVHGNVSQSLNLIVHDDLLESILWEVESAKFKGK
jgi:hypothetical protein